MLQSLELMEQNLLGQIRALRGLLLAGSGEKPVPVKSVPAVNEAKVNSELEKFFESLDGAEIRGATDGRDVPAGKKPNK